MEIVVRPADSPASPMSLSEFAQKLGDLQRAIEQAASIPVRVQAWLAPEMPENAAEILFDLARGGETGIKGA
jgi:hypothetical protein